DTKRTSMTERVPDPGYLDMSAFWEQEWQKNLMDAAIERVKRTANPKQYEVFHLNVVRKQPAGDVAKALNVNVAQVYLAKHRITALVKKEVRRLQKEMI